MNEVFTNIFVGNWLDGQKSAKSGNYFSINVTEVVENPFAQLQHKLCRQYTATDSIIVPVSDLDYLAGIIFEQLCLGKKVVVNCTAGIERSPLVVAWYLHKYCYMSLDEAYETIREKRPEILDRRNWIQYANLDNFLEENI